MDIEDEQILNIEGDPASPISRGCLCPQKFSIEKRTETKWEAIPLGQAIDMVAEGIRDARKATWEDKNEKGEPLRRTLAIAHLATPRSITKRTI